MASSRFEAIAAHLAFAQAKLASAATTIKVMEKNNAELKKLGGIARALLSREEQQDMEDQLKLTIDNYDECAQHLRATQQERNELATKLQFTENRLNGAKHNHTIAKEKLNSTSNELDSTKKHLDTVMSEQKQLEKRIGSAFDEINTAKNELDSEVQAHNHTKMKLEWAVTGQNNIAKELQNAYLGHHQLQFLLHNTQAELGNTKKELTNAQDDVNILTEESNNKITREAYDELQRKHDTTSKDLSSTKDELAKANARIAVLISAPHLKAKKTDTAAPQLDNVFTLSDAKKAVATVLHDLTTTRDDAQKKIAALEQTISEVIPTCDKTRTCSSCLYHLQKSLKVSRSAEKHALTMVDEANHRRMIAESELQDYKHLEAKYPVLTADAHIKEQAIKAAEARRNSGSESSSDGSSYEEGWLEKKYNEKIKAEVRKVDEERDRVAFERYCSERESEEEKARHLESDSSTAETASENDMAESDSGLLTTEPADQAVILHCDSGSAHSEAASEHAASDIIAQNDTKALDKYEHDVPELSPSITTTVASSEQDATEPTVDTASDIVAHTVTETPDEHNVPELSSSNDITVVSRERNNVEPTEHAVPDVVPQTLIQTADELTSPEISANITIDTPSEHDHAEPAATATITESIDDREDAKLSNAAGPAEDTNQDDLPITLECSDSISSSSRDNSPVKEVAAFSSSQPAHSDNEHLTDTSASTPHTSDNEGDDEDDDDETHDSTSDDEEDDDDSDTESLIIILETPMATARAEMKYKTGLPKPDALDMQVDAAAMFKKAVHAVAKAAVAEAVDEKTAVETPEEPVGTTTAPPPHTKTNASKKATTERAAPSSSSRSGNTRAPPSSRNTRTKVSPPTSRTAASRLTSPPSSRTSTPRTNPPPRSTSPKSSTTNSPAPLHHPAYQERKLVVRAQEAQRQADLGDSRKARNGGGYVQATLRRHLLAGMGEPRGPRSSRVPRAEEPK
ncbi:hypothetical protein BDV96DRAFT_642924 [Lophiotrema nucula]|uniref:Uncharacterized protein n=1 Tax=Lophiotrema nucula TaxID=690887 RepID=A0A6A5ZJY9_9PLEO|nr:hypothetical protein BDV96DRAFT_642924 [Lophiotrema nucula]